MGKVEIIPAKSPKEVREFMLLPYQLYKQDPCWVQPLWTTQKQLFARRDHPFYGHGEIQCFLARRDGHAVGRIAAILDHNFNRVHNQAAGFFGFFESVNDAEVARPLLEAASNWVYGRGARFIRGPMNPSANYECGLLTEGFASPPQVMMTYNPQYYADLIEGAGFRQAKDLYSFYLTTDDVTVERAERVAQYALETRGVQVRTLDMKNFDAEVERLWGIYNSAWNANWGFVPMTREEWSYLARELKDIAVPDLVLLGEVSGRLVAFMLALPDINQALGRTRSRFLPLVLFNILYHRRSIRSLRVVLLGVLEEFRTTGVAAALYTEIARRGRRLGYHDCEMSWILDDNVLMIRSIEMLGGKRLKTYRIYDRDGSQPL